jgi:predicted TIM-barrel fold metal-dependent hydrolase
MAPASTKLYFDTAGTGGWAPVVSYTASVVTADQMVFGTDYPLESHSAETMRELVEMIGGLDCPVEDRHRIASGTAVKLLGDALSSLPGR